MFDITNKLHKKVQRMDQVHKLEKHYVENTFRQSSTVLFIRVYR